MPMDEQARGELSAPFGEVYDAIVALQKIWSQRPRLLIAVGDDTIHRLVKNGVMPDIGVFDLRCMRAPLGREMEEAIVEAAGKCDVVRNPPGGVTNELSAAVEAALMLGSGWIRVDGEDDLAALVFFAKAPYGAVVLYGQPKQGMVWVEVNERLRGKAIDLLVRIKGK